MSESIEFRKNSLYDVSRAVTVLAGLASIVSVAALVTISRQTHVSRTLLIATSSAGAIAFTLFLLALVVACRHKTKAEDHPGQTVVERTIPPPERGREELLIENPEEMGAPIEGVQGREPHPVPETAHEGGIGPVQNRDLDTFITKTLPEQVDNFARFLTALFTPAGIAAAQIRELIEGLQEALRADYDPLLMEGKISIDEVVSELDSISGIGCDILVNRIGYWTLKGLSALSDERIKRDGPNEINQFINNHFKGPLAKRASSIDFMRNSLTAPIVQFAIKLVRTEHQAAWLTLFKDAGKAMKSEKTTPLSIGSSFIAKGIGERKLAF